MTATVTVQTSADGGRQLHCWLCAHNYSLNLHIPLGRDERRTLTRAHDLDQDGGS